MATRLRRELTRRGLKVADLVGVVINPDTGRPYSRNHIYAVANGESSATETCIAAIVAAVRKKTRDSSVKSTDLFDFEVKRAKAS